MTKAVVAYAKTFGAHVEGEIGALGKRELGIDERGNDVQEIYTSPEVADAYVQETGIDLLACAFGTAYGLYIKVPKLNFDVLKNVKKVIALPLVMHGGSV